MMDSQESFSGSTRGDLLSHLQLAKRGLVDVAKPPKQKQPVKKPLLNTAQALDDDLYVDSDDYSEESEEL